MFRIIREISQTVKMANEIASRAGHEPRWTLFLTNRSFIAQVVATVFAVAGIFGVILQVDEGRVVETIAAAGFLTSQGWALLERAWGKTAVVWNRDQAVKAVTEAEAVKNDALSKVLDKAIRG